MFRRLVPCLGTSALALAAFLVAAAPATAQHNTRGGGSSSWSGGRGGYNGWSGGNGGYNGWSGGRGGYYGGNYAAYYGGSYGGYYGQRYYSGGYNANYPQYYGSQYAPEANAYGSSYSVSDPSRSTRDEAAVSTYPPQDENVVHINVRVTPSAEIWFEGEKTSQTGSLRQFTSPPIDSDRECTYTIRARWTEGGLEVDRTRRISFHAGDQLTVNFMTRKSQGAAVDGKREERTPVSPGREDSAQTATRPPFTGTVSFAVGPDESTHDGKVVNVADNKIVMKGKDDSEHSHNLAANAQITCDNAVCKLEALKEGMRIRVTTKKDNKEWTATRIEALVDNVDFMKRN